MDQSVVICGDELDNVIFPTKNPEYGYIRVEQVVAKFSPGWIKREKRSALITGSMTDLQEFNLYVGMPIQGKIIVRECLKPFSEVNPERNIKRAGKNGIPCTVNGQPIYRQTFFTVDLEEKDELIQHDNTDEIIQAMSLDEQTEQLDEEIVEAIKQKDGEEEPQF